MYSRNKKQNNLNHDGRVLWLLYPTDTTQHAAVSHTMSPNKLRQVHKARSPWKKKVILTKTLPSRDNNHINSAPPGSTACQKKWEIWTNKKTHPPATSSTKTTTASQFSYEVKIAFKFNPQVESESKMRRLWRGSVDRYLLTSRQRMETN